MQDLKSFLDESYHRYNQRRFIENDPICIPHQFSTKADREISGLLAATISWGNRKSIIANAQKLIRCMDGAPHEFLLHYRPKDLKRFASFVHRTFNGQDCQYFIEALRHIYQHHGGLEAVFARGMLVPGPETPLHKSIRHFRQVFLELPHQAHAEKHLSDPSKKSSAKRICMFLRWMVRHDAKGVDFGIWPSLSPAQLCLPLDVHTGKVGRALGLLKRRQNDWQSVEEITAALRRFDPADPVKYDFALFGLGVDNVLNL